MDINLILGTIVEAAQNIWAALSIFGSWFAIHVWPTLWDLVIIGVIYKVIIAHWIADQIMTWAKKKLIKSKRQLALWIHFRDKAMNRGHKEDPQLCFDGLCKEVNDLK